MYLTCGQWAADAFATREGSLRLLLSPWRWQRGEAWFLRVMVSREERLPGLPCGQLREQAGFEVARDDSGVLLARAAWPWKRRGGSSFWRTREGRRRTR